MLGSVIHDEHVKGLHTLLLHAGRSKVDVIVMFDANAAAGASHPAKRVEKATEVGDAVGRVVRVG